MKFILTVALIIVAVSVPIAFGQSMPVFQFGFNCTNYKEVFPNATYCAFQGGRYLVYWETWKSCKRDFGDIGNPYVVKQGMKYCHWPPCKHGKCGLPGIKCNTTYNLCIHVFCVRQDKGPKKRRFAGECG